MPHVRIHSHKEEQLLGSRFQTTTQASQRNELLHGEVQAEERRYASRESALGSALIDTSTMSCAFTWYHLVVRVRQQESWDGRVVKANDLNVSHHLGFPAQVQILFPAF